MCSAARALSRIEAKQDVGRLEVNESCNRGKVRKMNEANEKTQGRHGTIALGVYCRRGLLAKRRKVKDGSCLARLAGGFGVRKRR